MFGRTLFEDFVQKDKLHNVWRDTFQNVINNIFQTKSNILTLSWFSISNILRGIHRYTWPLWVSWEVGENKMTDTRGLHGF